MYFYDVTTVADRIRCYSLYGDKAPAQCLALLQPDTPFGEALSPVQRSYGIPTCLCSA